PPGQPSEQRRRPMLARDRRRRRLQRLVVAILGISLVAVAVGRRSVLASMGWALVAEDPLQAVDVVVVAIDGGDAGVLEAADLVHSGIASRVAVFAEPPDAIDGEFLRRGVAFEDPAAKKIRQLHLLGIRGVERIPEPITGTENEGQVLPIWCT